MKKMFLVFALLVLFSAIGFAMVSTEIAKQYSTSTNKVTIYLSTGWNLFPFGDGLNTGGDPQSSDYCQSAESKSVFFWDSASKQYLGGAVSNSGPSSPEMQKASDMMNAAKSAGYAFGTMGAGWIYRSKPCTAEITFSGNALSGETGKKILQGWNIITIMPWMVAKSHNDIFGNCNIIKANSWSDGVQQWSTSSSAGATGLKSTNVMSPSYVGNTLVIYVTSACELSSTPTVPSPPALPQ